MSISVSEPSWSTRSTGPSRTAASSGTGLELLDMEVGDLLMTPGCVTQAALAEEAGAGRGEPGLRSFYRRFRALTTDASPPGFGEACNRTAKLDKGGIVFKTIVLALDGSEGSQRATPVAVELAQQNGGKIVIAHVEERIAAKGGANLYANEDEIQASIHNQANELSDQGIETSVEMSAISVGGPAHSIAEIANEAGADVIVVGTRGHSTVSGLLLGGVTQRLLHIADRPVLAVPPAA